MVAPHTFTPNQLALLQDAVLAGLAFDVQETPAVWLGAAAPAAASAAPAAATLAAMAAAAAAPVAPYGAPVLPKATLVAATAAAPVAVSAPAASVWDVWHQGATGGVVVVVSAATPPTVAAATLLQNILRAVGLAAAPLAFVGLQGSPDKASQPAAKQKLLAAVQALQAQQVLVLGQGVLGALVGKPLGVEGWQAAPQALGLPRLGVTYPLELLLAKPLFKSLAWQHLQRWQQLEA